MRAKNLTSLAPSVHLLSSSHLSLFHALDSILLHRSVSPSLCVRASCLPKSPRGFVLGAMTSAEVAADFQESLKDLQINNRYEISNLTIIAKENTEHAQAISRALESHIKTVSRARSSDHITCPSGVVANTDGSKQTSPNRKLPALFVLDSIVKNVGTPYTVYLGRSLFSTFMDAYTLVDSNTRRNMEGMLKTWKERVPGSIDPRPVFPAETVRPIETALLKAKTAAIQHQRHAQPQGTFRGTATPPQHNGQFAPPQGQHIQQPFPMPSQQVRSTSHPSGPRTTLTLCSSIADSSTATQSIRPSPAAFISRNCCCQT